MYCDLRSAISQSATIRKGSTTLSRLPSPTDAPFGDRTPWSVITTSTLVASLGIDRGNFATWRCRGIGPVELPASWFHPTTGSPSLFRVDAVLAWLAIRRGETLDTLASWRSWLDTHAGLDLSGEDPDGVRDWAYRWAQGQGADAYAKDGIKFTSEGYQSYLVSLLLL